MHLQIESLRLKQFYEWVRETFTPSYRKEIEDYLAEATDRFDLERRMTSLARRGMI